MCSDICWCTLFLHFLQTVEVRHGDMTVEAADAIVNAANKVFGLAISDVWWASVEYYISCTLQKLDHYGGIAYALRKAGGESIQDESKRFNLCVWSASACAYVKV